MKNIFIILFFFVSCNMFAQTKVEDVVKKDSILAMKYNMVTEGSVKQGFRYIPSDKKYSCPVFLDEKGFLYYVSVNNNYLKFITLDKNTPID